MFTGLIECTGTIAERAAGDRSVRLAVRPALESFLEVPVGGSVSVSGVCLTLERSAGGLLWFTAVAETLRRSTLADAAGGELVNLERSLRPIDRLDGHFVLGHVDGVGTIESDRREGDSTLRSVRVPPGLMPLLAEKGSVAIDGISLTIAQSRPQAIVVALVPHTMERTTMVRRRPGERVNIECDVLARYITHFGRGAPAQPQAGESLYQKLERLSF